MFYLLVLDSSIDRVKILLPQLKDYSENSLKKNVWKAVTDDGAKCSDSSKHADGKGSAEGKKSTSGHLLAKMDGLNCLADLSSSIILPYNDSVFDEGNSRRLSVFIHPVAGSKENDALTVEVRKQGWQLVFKFRWTAAELIAELLQYDVVYPDDHDRTV